MSQPNQGITPAPIGWRVTGQSHLETYTANGTFEPVVRVSFITDNGTTGSKDFPEARYNAANVIDTINAFVEIESQVAKLGNS